jgi:hypothetical protein
MKSNSDKAEELLDVLAIVARDAVRASGKETRRALSVTQLDRIVELNASCRQLLVDAAKIDPWVGIDTLSEWLLGPLADRGTDRNFAALGQPITPSDIETYLNDVRANMKSIVLGHANITDLRS